MLDRATRELFPPGSTFKTVVAAAALEAGVAGPDTLFDDPSEFQLPGSTATISNFGGGLCGNGSQVDLMRAFVRSCNTVFADLAIQVGAPDIGFMAEALGFNRDLDFPLPVAESVFPTAELENDDAALGQSGLGERNVRATPLQMAMVAAAVANDGVLMQPYLVDEMFDPDGNTVSRTEPEVLSGPCPRDGGNVDGDDGTGRHRRDGTAATVPGVRVAGKTGTAEAGQGAPIRGSSASPRSTTPDRGAVMFEPLPAEGTSETGGRVAAPVAAELIRGWLETRD